MYLPILILHSLVRWAVLVLGLWAVLRGLTGVLGPRPWTPADERAGRWFVIVTDVQTLLGLLLYGVFSPITRTALSDMGAAMTSGALRFWAVEHLAMMLVALVLVHIGRSRARKARFDMGKHKRAAIFYALALAAMLVAIPWPWMSDGRPLIRLG
jgi:uncharacterized membrane protein YozB (DUF420 family)